MPIRQQQSETLKSFTDVQQSMQSQMQIQADTLTLLMAV